MNLVERAFQKIEYNKFVIGKYEEIPEDEDRELHDILHKYKYRVASRDYFMRLSLLKHESSTKNELSYYAKKFGIRGVRKIHVSNGEIIYRIPVFCFPGGDFLSHYTNCYLIIGKQVTLVDCAAPNSEKSMEEGFNVVRNFYGESVKIEDIDNVIITHAHVDHSGRIPAPGDI